jgi:hypothetical protein
MRDRDALLGEEIAAFRGRENCEFVIFFVPGWCPIAGEGHAIQQDASRDDATRLCRKFSAVCCPIYDRPTVWDGR